MKKMFQVTFLIGLFSVSYVNAQLSSTLKQFYWAIDSVSAIPMKSDQLPLIGISAARTDSESSLLSMAYSDAVIKAGGLPFIIPVTTDPMALKAFVERIDGLILSGGTDVVSSYYDETVYNETVYTDSIRDVYEFTLVRLATNRNVPVLGICRGEQLLNVAFGGKLYQDLPAQIMSTIIHKQEQKGSIHTHSVFLPDGTIFKRMMRGTDTLQVNSFHHQGVKVLAPDFKPIAFASDSLIEGIEALPDRMFFGVQWHPEALYAGGNEQMLSPFVFLVGKANVYKRAKELHQRILSLDTHCDTPLQFRKPGFSIAKRDSNLVNLPKMKEGRLDGIYMVAFIAQGERDKASSKAAVAHTEAIIDQIYKQAEVNPDLCGIVQTKADFVRLKQEGKKALFIGIENGYAIGKDLKNLALFKKKGVTYITLCHNKNNDICDSSSDKGGKEWNGLSPFGREVVSEMNRLGILIDLSHAHEKTFWDVIRLSKQPVVATHSSAYALRAHDRNLTDEQLRILAKNGGVVQVCPLGFYIHSDREKANLTFFLDHIDHIVKVAGINHVGIGSDFDGGGGITGLKGANDMINITMGLIERGYSDTDIEKIWGGNFLRVLTQVQK
ncbi:MAG: gamma-glutamyl-gamma-aminobutyrate hydrolase family protein [Massilibacteroides sp.]|nr:gamma-glutamyl-gamma-aminobutyrate hydrolase family protein [Massilibacteroides sp.]